MTDYVTLRSDQGARLYQPEIIVGWTVKYAIGDVAYKREFLYELDATEFYNEIIKSGLDGDLDPIWGWYVKSSGTAPATHESIASATYTVIWIMPDGDEILAPQTYENFDEAEDLACQVRLAGFMARVQTNPT